MATCRAKHPHIFPSFQLFPKLRAVEVDGLRYPFCTFRFGIGHSTSLRCAVKSASPQRVQVPPGSWFAPPGSNQSGYRGNEVVGASGVEGRLGDLASM